MRTNLLFSIVVFVAMTFTACNQNKPEEPKFVDLGLPSGTLWKNQKETSYRNYEGQYTYDEAIETFGNQLPTQEQWQELISKCEWTHMGTGLYKVTGPNGNFIEIKHHLTLFCNGKVDNGEWDRARYWSSTKTKHDDEKAYYLYVDWDSNNKEIFLELGSGEVCGGLGVILVKNP